MRKILEDALITYRQEASNLLIFVGPAVVVGPIAVLIAASGLPAALAMLPVFLLLYLATYAACVRAAASVLHNLSPDPGMAYLEVLSGAPYVLRAAAPGAALLAGVAGVALVLGDLVAPLLGLAVAWLGGGGVLLWLARHAYDQPLILAHGLRTDDVARAGEQLAEDGFLWTLTLLTVVALPLLLAGLLAWGLAAVVTAPFGAAVFALAVALWLPLPALSLTIACSRLVGDQLATLSSS
jgi:hypothetical protein